MKTSNFIIRRFSAFGTIVTVSAIFGALLGIFFNQELTSLEILGVGFLIFHVVAATFLVRQDIKSAHLIRKLMEDLGKGVKIVTMEDILKQGRDNEPK